MPSTRLQEIRNYQKKLRKLLDKSLFDIILFGSFVKGGSPKDIDIALLAKEGIDVTPIKKQLRNIFNINIDVHLISTSSIYQSIWLSLIKEGFSIKQNKFLYELYNISPVVLFKYSLIKLNAVQKVQFSRGIKQAIGKEGKVLTRSVVLVPISMKNEFMEFLKTWNIYYESHEFELLPVLRKEEFT